MRLATPLFGAIACLLIGVAIGRWSPPLAHFAFSKKITGSASAIPPDEAAFRSARLAYFKELKRTSDVVAFGDSTTELANWAELFPRWSIANRGIRWDTAGDLLSRQSDVTAMRPRIVVIMVGMNDLLVGLPPAEVVHKIGILSERFVNVGIVPVVILPLKVSSTFWMNINPKVQKLDLLERGWCKNHNVLFLDLNPILAPHGSLDSSFTSDGLHPTDLGYLRAQPAIEATLIKATDSEMVSVRHN